MSTLYPGPWAAEMPDKPAIVMAGTAETMTYGELHATANRFARVLRARGLEPGDHVTLCCENRLEYPALIWGAHYAGLYYTLVNARAAAAEIAYIVRNSGSSVLVLSDAVAGAHLAALPGLLPGVAILTLGPVGSAAEPLDALLADASPADLTDATEGVDMLYTSGTTGHPKGVKRRLTGQPLGTSGPYTILIQAMFAATEQSVYLSPAPLYHAGPCKWVQGFTSIGATAVIMPRFDPELALQSIEQHRVTHSQWVPTMFSRLLRLPDAVRAKFDLSSQQVAVHAAAPCPIPVKRAMFDWWGPIIYEYYGGTEGIGATFCSPADWLAHPGTVGRPMMGQVHIVGEDGTEVTPGTVGAVYFSGGATVEYHGDPEKTAAATLPNGWSTMGDVGRVDADGYLYLTDRRNFVINRGGANVYPQESENVLAGHPLVADSAVIGVPDDDLGQEVKAIVQLVPGAAADDTTATELLRYCREQLGAFKCPKTVDFRESLPRDDNGKLYKRSLIDEYWAGRDSRLV